MVFQLFSVETIYYLLWVMGDHILSLRHHQCLDCPTALGPQCLWHMLLGNNSVASAPRAGLPGPQKGHCLLPEKHFRPHSHQQGVRLPWLPNLGICFFSWFLLPFGVGIPVTIIVYLDVYCWFFNWPSAPRPIILWEREASHGKTAPHRPVEGGFPVYLCPPSALLLTLNFSLLDSWTARLPFSHSGVRHKILVLCQIPALLRQGFVTQFFKHLNYLLIWEFLVEDSSILFRNNFIVLWWLFK